MTDDPSDRPDAPALERRPIENILVALDASPHSSAALAAAVELAAQLGAEVTGVFVEDINLLRMAQLRITVEVGAATGRVRRMNHQRITYGLRSQADRARQALQRLADRLQVPWEFRVLRGVIDRELLSASTTADLVILGRVGWSDKQVLGSTAEAVLTAAPARVLLLGSQHRLYQSLLAVFDGSAMSERALDTALLLARRAGRFLSVGVAAGDEAEARRLQAVVAERVQAAELQARYRWLIGMDSRELAKLIRRFEASILVLPAESPLLAGKRLRKAIEEFDCPVLVVR